MTKPTFFYSLVCPVCLDVLRELKREKIDLNKRCRVVNCDSPNGRKLASNAKIKYVPTLITENKKYEGEDVICGLKGKC